MKTTYQAGKWLAICDICGFRFYNDQLKKDWRGLMTCVHDHEPRHPQEFIRVKSDTTSVPWTRPDPVVIFITNDRSSAIAGQAIAGVAITGKT
jgi:hypothetical protein